MPLRASLFDRISGLYLARPKGSGVSTTISAAAAAGATTIALTSATGAVDKKPYLLGASDDQELLVQNGAPSGSNINVFTGLKKAHAALDALVEATIYDLGEVVNTAFADSAERRDLISDVSRNPYGNALGFLMYCLRTRFQSVDVDHLAFALGLPLTAVTGAGTQADPSQLFTDGSDIGRAMSWLICAALDEDGTLIYDERDAGDSDYTGLSIPLSQGADAGLDCKFVQRMHPRAVKGALNFVADVSKRITRAHYAASLLEAGYFQLKAGGLSTTTTAPTSVDGTVVSLTSATGVAAGKWYLIESGGKSQIIWVQSLATLDATLRTRIKYVFPIGATVKELETVNAGGLKEGSTSLQIAGQVRAARFDNSRTQAGIRASTSRFGLGFAPTTFNLETLRRRLGLPSSAIAGGTVLTVSDLVGTDAPLGVYARVQRNDTKQAWFVLNATDNMIAQLELALSQSDMLGVPLEHVGQSLQVLQYAP